MKKISELPLYLKIADELRARLLLLPLGAPFETEQSLMEEFDVSRGTVRQALNQLVQEGLLVRTQGSGSFRSQPADSPYRFTLSQELTDSLRKIGSYSSVRNLSITVIAAPPDVADTLCIPRGTKVRRVARIRAIDGNPYAYCVAYLRTDKVPPFYKHDYSGSLGGLVRNELRVHIGKRRCDFQATAADAIVSEALAIPVGSPVLEIRLVCLGHDEQPLLTDTFWFPASQSLHFEV